MRSSSDTDHDKAQLNHFAIRSFRNTADQDYIHARLAYRARLMPQFFWSSLHCLEKYGKGILLLNRIDGRNIKHELSKSLQKINESNLFSITISDQSLEFLTRLESTARFRYSEVSWHNRDHDLVRLDELVSTVRRYCQPLNYTIKYQNDNEIDFLKINLEEINQAYLTNKRNTCIRQGTLEKILGDKEDPARGPLIWNNLYFCSSKRKSVRMQPFRKSENAPLYNHPELLDEVCKYIYLPNKLKQAYKELIKDRNE
jgi:hypothetical protein